MITGLVSLGTACVGCNKNTRVIVRPHSSVSPCTAQSETGQEGCFLTQPAGVRACRD
jgi:hypothetical protein